MNISIIIPSYNTQETMANTLAHVEAQHLHGLTVEVIVVDCSEHDKVETIVKQFSFVKYHKENVRFNPGRGRNIGAESALGELLIFIDADIELEDQTVFNAYNRFKAGAKIFGGCLELNPKTSIGVASYLEHFYFNHETHVSRPAQPKKNLSSAFMCFDKNLFLSEGGFKDIPRMQDTELTERLRAKGNTLMFYPDLVALQTQDSPLKKVLRKIYIGGQNLYYIRYQKNFNFIKKVLFSLALPFIALTKIARIIGRHLIYQRWPNKLRTIALIPLLIYAVLHWMVGLYQAMYSETGISDKRD